jgi:hypothetical protein
MVQLQKNSEGLSYSTELKNRRLSDTLRRLDKTSNNQPVVFFNLEAWIFAPLSGSLAYALSDLIFVSFEFLTYHIPHLTGLWNARGLFANNFLLGNN